MALFQEVLGEFRWLPPAWIARIGRRRLLLSVGSALLFAIGSIIAYRYYDALPKPPQVIARTVAPGITPIVDDKLAPEPLLINFSIEADPRTAITTTNSVANLALIGEEITAGVSLRPAINGTWHWQSETQLRFTPDTDWPAGQEYTVFYEQSLFAPNLLLGSTKVSFKTPEFSATLDSLSFYQDPVERSVRKAVAELSFTHPVDKDSLEQHLTYAMRETGETLDAQASNVAIEITYDKQRRRAYVHSAVLEIPQQENYLSLKLAEGLAPNQGPSRFQHELQQNLTIPDKSSYFKITNIKALIARNNDDEPLQTLTFELTDRVSTSDLSEKLSAYLLPKSPTINGVVKRNKYWQSPREVTTAILAQAKKLELDLNPVENNSAALHSASIDVPENRTLYLVVGEGLRSEAEFILSRQYDTLVRTPAYPKEAKIAQSGAILPLTRDHQLSFVSRGVNTLKVDIGRLLNSQVNHLASQTRGDFKSPQFNNYNFDADNLTTLTTRFIGLNPEHPRSSTFASLDLSEFLPGGGYYFVTVQGWNKGKNHGVGSADTRFVLVTDLGLLVKTNANGTQDVFVHSIESGLPLAGAKVALLGKNGVPVMEQTTAPDGHTVLPATKGLRREKTPTVYVVRNGDDSVFMPFARSDRRLQYSRFDIGGEYDHGGINKDQLKAQLFTDRGLYRPGDTAKLAAIVKRDDWVALGELPLALDIRDPRGRLVLDKRLKLPKNGFLDEPFTTEAASPTGNYNATLHLIDARGGRRAIGSTTFKVEEFLPDRLRIRSTISGQKPVGWLKPDNLVCQVSLNNLFGTPAESRQITGELELKPKRLQISRYPGFVFGDPLRENNNTVRSVRRTLAATTTNADGLAELPLDLAQYDKGIYQLTVYTDGFEAGGGRSVSAQASVMLSPLDYLIGHKKNSDLNFLTKNSDHSVEFLSVDSTAQSIPLTDLTLTLVEEKFVSALVKRKNGTFAYQSVKKADVISSKPWAIPMDGTSYQLPTDRPGSFALRISDADGLTYSHVSFTVAGGRNLANNLERDAELKLSLNGSSFEPGEVIEMEVTAPYTGTGLITIERDSVYSYQWFQASTTTSVQSIRVPEGLEGNAYINVAFVRDIDSPEIFVSPLSYAVAPFSISRAKRTVDIELTAPQLVRPGASLDIGYRASRPAKMVIYAVDEGVLQVAKYQQPDPLEFFLRKKALQVSTSQMVDLILPEFESYKTSAAPGGGEAKSLAGKNLNPFRRQTEAPVAFWSGIVDAGTQEKTVTFNVPDSFNGQLRLFAVAVADSAVGSASGSSTVRGPFVITPNLLTAAAPGDEFDVTVGLSNNLADSGANAPIKLSIYPSRQLEIVSEDSLVLNIDEGREGRATFRVKVLDQPGAATLDFLAHSGSEQTKLSATLSVRPPAAYVATVAAGVDESDPFELRFERTLYDQLASQSVAASVSPLVLTDGLLNYLDAYPHACAEQIVSKVFPQIGFLGNEDYAIDEATIRASFDATVQKLRGRQSSDGGFLFWTTSSEAAGFPSVYVMHFLTDAKELGLSVPRAMLSAGVAYLRELAAREAQTLPQARLRAYAIYVLTRNGIITTNYITNLHEFLDRDYDKGWHSDLTATYLAASYNLLKQHRLSDRLLGKYKMGDGDEMVSDFDTRLGRDAQHVYLLARHFPKMLKSIDAEAIKKMVEPIMRNQFNTLSSAYTVLALGAYSNTLLSSDAATKLSLTASVGDTSQVLQAAALYARARVENNVEALEVSGADGQAVYYVLSQTGFDRTPPKDALTEGLELQRAYLNKNGKAVTQANIGAELTVRLRIRSTGRTRSNVAVVDMLPGGFEVVTDSVRDQYKGWNVDYKDIREDRVVLYGSFGDRATEITYRVKVTASGMFVAPSAFAGSMYDRSIQARTSPGQFQVKSLL